MTELNRSLNARSLGEDMEYPEDRMACPACNDAENKASHICGCHRRKPCS